MHDTRDRRSFTQLIHMLVALCALLALVGCKHPITPSIVGRIEHTGVLEGFSEGMEASPGKKLYFEPSAVIRDGDIVLVASDKPIPGKSPVIGVPVKEFAKAHVSSSVVKYSEVAAFKNSEKIESFASSKKWNFAATDFEWITDNPQEADTYNNLIAWPVNHPESARILWPSQRAGITSSKGLRAAFNAALATASYPKGPPYYKIEGLVSPDDETLIFGVREIGTNYQAPEYTFILLRAKLHRDSQTGITVEKGFEKLLDWRPYVAESQGVGLGLSSIEFDSNSQLFFALTSFERKEELGAYLWVFSASDLQKGTKPRLVKDELGKPLYFPHKAEGIVALGDGRLLVICDDDRVLTPVRVGSVQRARKPNEAAYFVVTVRFRDR